MKKYFLNQCLSVCMSIYVNTLNLNVSRSRHIEAGALFKRRSLDRGRARVVNFFFSAKCHSYKTNKNHYTIYFTDVYCK
jgi:hypothetical protein